MIVTELTPTLSLAFATRFVLEILIDEPELRTKGRLVAVTLSNVITIVSVIGPQGPAGSSVVSVSVTDPAAISPALGVYTAFRVFVSGPNEPAPPLQ